MRYSLLSLRIDTFLNMLKCLASRKPRQTLVPEFRLAGDVIHYRKTGGVLLKHMENISVVYRISGRWRFQYGCCFNGGLRQEYLAISNGASGGLYRHLRNDSAMIT